jgi:hypothetical protein
MKSVVLVLACSVPLGGLCRSVVEYVTSQTVRHTYDRDGADIQLHMNNVLFCVRTAVRIRLSPQSLHMNPLSPTIIKTLPSSNEGSDEGSKKLTETRRSIYAKFGMDPWVD